MNVVPMNEQPDQAPRELRDDEDPELIGIARAALTALMPRMPLGVYATVVVVRGPKYERGNAAYAFEKTIENAPDMLRGCAVRMQENDR
jgi:hypothetical protein